MGMTSVGMRAVRRAIALGPLWLAGSAVPLMAQRPVVAQGTATPFEAEVDRLVQEFLQKRRTAMGVMAALQELQLASRTTAIAEGQRPRVELTMRRLQMQLAALEADGSRLQRRLSEICATDRQPDGWVGIVYSGSASTAREEDGRVVIRFFDNPVIESVEPGSPAEKAGVRGGDLLLSMSGRDLRNAEVDFTPLLKPGTRIPFKVRRGVETKLLTVMVEPRPGDYSTPCPWVDERIAAAFAPLQMTLTITSDGPPLPPTTPPPGASGQARVVVQRVPPAPAGAPTPPGAPASPLPPVGVSATSATSSTVVFAGVQLVTVGPELAEALGVERGLLVVTAGRGSPAEQSGLRAGDVLLSADGRPLATPLVFLQAVEDAPSRELRLQLLRKRRPVTVTLRW